MIQIVINIVVIFFLVQMVFWAIRAKKNDYKPEKERVKLYRNHLSDVKHWTEINPFVINSHNTFTGDLSGWSALSEWTSITEFKLD